MCVSLPPLVRNEVTMWIISVRTEARGEELPTWEQSSITSSTTEVLDFIHTRPAAQRRTAQSGASLSFSLTHTRTHTRTHTHTHTAARHQNIIKKDTVVSVLSAIVYSHCSQVYKKHATEKTGTNSREKKMSKERRRERRKEERREKAAGKWGEGEINIETVDHKNRTPGSRWAEEGVHHI